MTERTILNYCDFRLRPRDGSRFDYFEQALAMNLEESCAPRSKPKQVDAKFNFVNSKNKKVGTERLYGRHGDIRNDDVIMESKQGGGMGSILLIHNVMAAACLGYEELTCRIRDNNEPSLNRLHRLVDAGLAYRDDSSFWEDHEDRYESYRIPTRVHPDALQAALLKKSCTPA